MGVSIREGLAALEARIVIPRPNRRPRFERRTVGPPLRSPPESHPVHENGPEVPNEGRRTDEGYGVEIAPEQRASSAGARVLPR